MNIYLSVYLRYRRLLSLLLTHFHVLKYHITVILILGFLSPPTSAEEQVYE